MIVEPPSTTRPSDEVLAQRPRDGDRVDAGMRPEAPILCRDRRRDEHRRQALRVEVHAARAVARQRLVERHAATIDDDGRRHVVRDRGARDRSARAAARARGRGGRPGRPPPATPMATERAAHLSRPFHRRAFYVRRCLHFSMRVGPHPHALSRRSFAPRSGRRRCCLHYHARGPHPRSLRAATSRGARAAGAADRTTGILSADSPASTS